MSYEALRWAWDRIARHPELGVTRRMLLLALANCHNGQSGRCDPSLDTLVRDTGMDRHTIPPAIRDLETLGILTVQRTLGLRSQYVLSLTATGGEIPTGGSGQNRTSGHFLTGGENPTATSGEKRTQSRKEPGIERDIPPLTPPTLDATLFERFWRAYPKKRSKGLAERAFAKLKPTEPLLAEILLGLQRAMTSDHRFQDARYIPHPATWLNAKGWQDEAEPELPKPATSAAYGQQPGKAKGHGGKHETDPRLDNSAIGKVRRAIASRDAAKAGAGGGGESRTVIEAGPDDYTSAH